ncbi:MAG: hypothetical protein ACI9OO_000405 [Bacteroidia bacterium]|jgi:uncharacterized protein (TIGR02001 family)
MKKVKNILTASAAAAAIALSAAPAMAELEASAAVSNIYLFRGVDQGGGSAAVSGDLVYSNSTGLYAGAWVSSASSYGNGGEIDTFAGWSGSFGDFGVDVGLLDYYYPGGGNDSDDLFRGLTEFYLGLSFAGVEFYYYDQITGKSTALDDNTYMSLGYGMSKFSVVLGIADPEEAKGQKGDSDYVHLDVGYAYNDNLSFTLSQVIDKDDSVVMEDDLQVVLSYSIPLN